MNRSFVILACNDDPAEGALMSPHAIPAVMVLSFVTPLFAVRDLAIRHVRQFSIRRRFVVDS
jgi:hypothetical protein